MAGILDGERVRNVGLGIGRVKAANEKVVQAILRMDDTTVNPQLINLMLTNKLYPTAEEREELLDWQKADEAHAKGEGEHPGQLNKVEKFFMALSSIEKLGLRLKCMDTLHTFSEQFTGVENDVNTLLAATKAVADSATFKEWLTLVLATGNYMNGKSKRGCAFGFELSTLDKLVDTKSTAKPTTTLLQWIVKFVKETLKKPEMLDLDKDWTVLEPVKTVLVQDLVGNLDQIKAKLKLCEAQAAKEREPGDRFNDTMKPFIIKAKKASSTLETKLTAAKRKFTELYGSYGENVTKMNDKSIREFWDRLKNFSENIIKAAAANEELAAKLEKQEEAERKKAAREEKKKNKAAGKEAKKEGSVFEQFKAARAGNADDIVANIKAGRKGMRRKKR